MFGVEQCAEIRGVYRVERLSIRAISKRPGLHRKTVRRALAAEVPPRYARAPAGSTLDPFGGWICDQVRADPSIQPLRLCERREPRVLAMEVRLKKGAIPRRLRRSR